MGIWCSGETEVRLRRDDMLGLCIRFYGAARLNKLFCRDTPYTRGGAPWGKNKLLNGDGYVVAHFPAVGEGVFN